MTVVGTAEQSKAVTASREPSIVIAASGMATGGRVLHHLAEALPDGRNTVLFVGYQAAGTRGRTLVDGIREVKMLGRIIPVMATIERVDSMSAHADADEIMRWLSGIAQAAENDVPRPRRTDGPPRAGRKDCARAFLARSYCAAPGTGRPGPGIGYKRAEGKGQRAEKRSVRLQPDGQAMLKKVLVIMSIVGSAACGRGSSDYHAPAAPPAPADRKYLLERVDEAAVVQMYADGFAELSLKEKTLVWHLYQAALAGRDIFYDQRYAHNLEMRDLLEAVLTHKAGIDPATLSEIERYTKLFWINSGPFNNLTARKFVLSCTPEAFAAAAQAAAERRRAAAAQERRDARSAPRARLKPMFFDPDVDSMVTNKTPPKGQDILASSANNLYVGLTMKDLEGYREAHPLNSRLVKQNGKIVEEVYRVNGRYGGQIAAIVQHLEAAIPFATEPMAEGARARSSKFYRTGETGRPRGVRHRLGAGQGVVRGHDQRVHRGVSGRARHQGRDGKRSSST